MALIPGQGSLFTEGEGSNDPIVPNPAPDLGAAGVQRQQAAQTVSNSTESPEAFELAHKELEEQKKVLAVQERKIAREKAYERAIQRTAAAIKAVKENKDKEMRALAREAGAWNPKEGYIIIDDEGKEHFMMPDEYRQALKGGDEEKRKLAEKFEKQVAARLTRKQGFGTGQSNQATNRPGFHFGDLFSALTTGNIGGIARELMQPLGKGADDWKVSMGEKGANMAARGKEMGGFGGMLRGLGGRGMAMLPALASPAALIAAQQAFSRASAQTRATIAEGQVTGGGFSEGLASRREAISLAINPFDMMDRRTAQQIVKGIRGRGFTGELGRALQDTVGDVFQDLGTDIEETMTMVTDITKNGTMSLDEFRDTMRDLDDQAKATGLSVKAVQGNLKSVMDLAGQAGGIEAQRVAMGAADPLGRIFSNLQAAREGQLGTITQPVLRQAALMHGVPAFMAGGAEVQRNQAKFFDDYTNFLWDMMNRMPSPMNTPNGLALFLVSANPELIGGITDVVQAELFLKDLFKAKKSGGFQKAFREAAQRQVEQESKNALESHTRISKRGWRRFAPGIGMVVDKITGAEGTPSAVGMRQSLAEIHEGLVDAGVSEARINEILRQGREVAFSKKLSPDAQADRFQEIYDRIVEAAQQEVKVTMDLRPEAGRYFQGINGPNMAYISQGKNSQYIMRPPPIGR